ncbi:MAG: radical SAM protein [Thermodesulfovibrionales bacterium]
MKYYLSSGVSLKWLEVPCVYNIKKDELYEIDDESFAFLKKCSVSGCFSEKNDFIDYCLNEGILTTKKTDLKPSPLLKSPEPSLRYLELQITNKCNLRCKHCYIDNKDSLEISSEFIKKILKEFEEMQGLRVLITGGEPLLHSKFDEINKILPDFSIRKVLFTNGILLEKEKIKTLNVEEIQISIDGLENAHDSLRGRGAFKKSMKTIRLLLDYGFHVSISTMVHPANLGDFEEMQRLFKDIGIKEWTVDVPCITGRLRENEEFHIRPEEGGKYLEYGYGSGIHSSSPGYACGYHLMSVMADGKVAKCSFYSDKPVGTIEEGLRTCWERIKPIKLGELKCDCKYIEFCRGGCRYRAQILGDPLGKDFYRCALFLSFPE